MQMNSNVTNLINLKSNKILGVFIAYQNDAVSVLYVHVRTFDTLKLSMTRPFLLNGQF